MVKYYKIAIDRSKHHTHAYLHNVEIRNNKNRVAGKANYICQARICTLGFFVIICFKPGAGRVELGGLRLNDLIE